MRGEDLLPPSATRQLSDDEIAHGAHRDLTGGLWDEIGPEQLAYLRREGLEPRHRLLDVGCGALRGGVRCMAYLEPGHYYGVDANASLIRAGREVEMVAAGVVERAPHLRVDDTFDVGAFGVTFDYAWAYSVFTHLPLNAIERCLVNVAAVLAPGGRFLATHRPAPSLHHLAPIEYPHGITTYPDRNPYHYNFEWFELLIRELPLEVEDLGGVRTPGGSRMLRFTRV
jgi:SAM-dependent methyltransferase